MEKSYERHLNTVFVFENNTLARAITYKSEENAIIASRLLVETDLEEQHIANITDGKFIK